MGVELGSITRTVYLKTAAAAEEVVKETTEETVTLVEHTTEDVEVDVEFDEETDDDVGKAGNIHVKTDEDVGRDRVEVVEFGARALVARDEVEDDGDLSVDLSDHVGHVETLVTFAERVNVDVGIGLDNGSHVVETVGEETESDVDVGIDGDAVRVVAEEDVLGFRSARGSKPRGGGGAHDIGLDFGKDVEDVAVSVSGVEVGEDGDNGIDVADVNQASVTEAEVGDDGDDGIDVADVDQTVVLGDGCGKGSADQRESVEGRGESHFGKFWWVVVSKR